MIPKGSQEKGYQRSKELNMLKINTKIILRKNSPIIEFETTVDNHSEDHRLRVAIPTGIDTDYVYADSHFTVQKRRIDVVQPLPQVWIEDASAQGAQKRFVCVQDEMGGTVVYNQGIQEYEVMKGRQEAIILLTLIRAVDRIATDRSYTTGCVPGPQQATPDAQCFGKTTLCYGISLYEGIWEKSDLNYLAECYHIGLKAVSTTIHEGKESLPDGFAIDNRKKAIDTKNIVMRLCSYSNEDEDAFITGLEGISAVYLTDLKELCLNQIPIVQDGVKVHIKPCEILTLKFLAAE